MTYPDYFKVFEIYTNASSKQLGAVITQDNRPILFFSRKLSDMQCKYSVTEIELLAIVKTLKEFKGMLWGQNMKVFTDHTNLMRDALGLTLDRVYQWRLLLEEYGPKIIYVKGIHNTFAEAKFPQDKSQEQTKPSETKLDDGLEKLVRARHRLNNLDSYTSKHDDWNLVFAHHREEDEVHPLTLIEIVDAQCKDQELKVYYKKNAQMPQKDLCFHLIEDIKVLCKNGKIIIPASLRRRAVSWYHHYLQHPGHSRLEKTMRSMIYWKGMHNTIWR